MTGTPDDIVKTMLRNPPTRLTTGMLMEIECADFDYFYLADCFTWIPVSKCGDEEE